MSKSLITNLIAATITIYGFFSPIYSAEIYMAGLFSLSGALTNWLAIHMLFEKIPFLYGSGVISLKFNEFKIAIKNLMMDQFFSENFMESILKKTKKGNSNNIFREINYEEIFNKLVEAIEESTLGSTLKMFGGKEALNPLKEPIKKKITELLDDLSNSNLNNEKTLPNFRENIENIIDSRLAELTPEHIKEIIKKIIHEHLGWLVLWGGVLGFILGLTFGLLENLN